MAAMASPDISNLGTISNNQQKVHAPASMLAGPDQQEVIMSTKNQIINSLTSDPLYRRALRALGTSEQDTKIATLRQVRGRDAIRHFRTMVQQLADQLGQEPVEAHTTRTGRHGPAVKIQDMAAQAQPIDPITRKLQARYPSLVCWSTTSRGNYLVHFGGPNGEHLKDIVNDL